MDETQLFQPYASSLFLVARVECVRRVYGTSIAATTTTIAVTTTTTTTAVTDVPSVFTGARTVDENSGDTSCFESERWFP